MFTQSQLFSRDISENVKDTVCAAGTDAFSNHVVLKQVFLHLDTPTLLKLSLVNKIWCSTARMVLRTYKKCLAQLKGKKPCKELRELNKILSSSLSHEHPYSGLAVRTCPKLSVRDQVRKSRGQHRRIRRNIIEESSDNDSDSDTDDFRSLTDEESIDAKMGLTDVNILEFENHRCIKANSIARKYKALMERLVFRHLEIHWDENNRLCPAEKLVRKILKEKRESFEELKITQIPDSIISLKEYLLIENTHWLPNLKILDIFPEHMTPDWDKLDCENPLKCELVQAAPKLEKLLGLNRHFDLNFFLDNRKTSLIKHYLVTESDFLGVEDNENDNQRSRIMNFGISNPKLTRFLFHGYYLDWNASGAGFKAMIEFLKMLLSSSSSLLEVMLLYHSMFINLVPIIFELPFSSLKELTLGIYNWIDRRLEIPVLTRFNWCYFFPVLETVKCMASDDCFSDRPITGYANKNIEREILEQLSQRRGCSPCLTVVKMVFEGRLDLAEMEYYSDLFPNVKYVTYVGATQLDEILAFLWKAWPQLKQISFSYVPTSAIMPNLDARLCGISEALANLYRTKSMTFLRSQNLTTVAPSILWFQCLKTLRIEILHSGLPCSGDKKGIESNMFLFTHVAGLLAFPKMPGFEVEILRDVCESQGACEFNLEHLRPFVKLMD